MIVILLVYSMSQSLSGPESHAVYFCSVGVISLVLRIQPYSLVLEGISPSPPFTPVESMWVPSDHCVVFKHSQINCCEHLESINIFTSVMVGRIKTLKIHIWEVIGSTLHVIRNILFPHWPVGE